MSLFLFSSVTILESVDLLDIVNMGSLTKPDLLKVITYKGLILRFAIVESPDKAIRGKQLNFGVK